jgi:hypothetical protein
VGDTGPWAVGRTGCSSMRTALPTSGRCADRGTWACWGKTTNLAAHHLWVWRVADDTLDPGEPPGICRPAPNGGEASAEAQSSRMPIARGDPSAGE